MKKLEDDENSRNLNIEYLYIHNDSNSTTDIMIEKIRKKDKEIVLQIPPN